MTTNNLLEFIKKYLITAHDFNLNNHESSSGSALPCTLLRLAVDQEVNHNELSRLK